MTTRRGFLGLLAAAPIAAPAMAKAAAEEMTASRSAVASLSAISRNMGSIVTSGAMTFGECVDGTITAKKLSVGSLKPSVDTTEVEAALKRLNVVTTEVEAALKRLNVVTTEPLKPEVAAMLKMSNHPDVASWPHVDDLDRTLFGDLPLTVPNRLYGATINEHGEAV